MSFREAEPLLARVGKDTLFVRADLTATFIDGHVEL